MKDPKFIVIDLFCGAGGTSTGFSKAMCKGHRAAVIAACVNHDAVAIESHWANHPEVYHFNEDITKLYGNTFSGTLFQAPEFIRLKRIVNIYRAFYPQAKVILWASLECTNFSNAKGGQPRDADSRTLAEHLHYYVDGLQPDYVQIENVVEFMAWGPLDENDKPISRDKGKDWLKWRNKMNKFHKLADVWNIMNSANYGSLTARKRLFGCFAKGDNIIVWPKTTHAKVPKKGEQQWRACKPALKLNIKGESIFNRKKDLAPKTLGRVYAGLLKFVANGDDSFLVQTYSASSNGHNTFSINKPARTITTRDSTQIVQPEFLSGYYGTGINVSSVKGPCPTLTTNDRIALVQSTFMIDQQYGNSLPASVDVPAGTLTANPKLALVESEFILNPSHGGHCTTINAPCVVIVARQDKAPLYLVQTEVGDVAIPIYDTDCEEMVKIKKLMMAYRIKDVYMRMLMISELKSIQGFPEDYILRGTQKDQKKFIGNSVEPNIIKAWAEALAEEIDNLEAA